MSSKNPLPTAALVISGLAVAAVVMVATSLRRPEPPSFAPTVAEPEEVEEARVGPVTFTVDSSDPERWIFFDFSRGAVVEAPGPLGWDLAIRRFEIIANGGEGFQGVGGAADLGAVAFDSVRSAPAEGWAVTQARRDSVNEALSGWYDYGFASHLLTPKPRVYAVRTADGRYAKLEILSYYCPGALPGCLTFRYVYQGRGGTDFTTGAPPGSEEASGSPR